MPLPTLKFDASPLVSGAECCAHGVKISFTLENMTAGTKYVCSFSNIGPGSVIFKPETFTVTGTSVSEQFVAVAEFRDYRANIIKLRVYEEDLDGDYVEDILPVECGTPKYLQVTFNPKEYIFETPDTYISLISEIIDVMPGNNYHYEFSTFANSESIYTTFSPPSGSIVASDTTMNINTLVKYNGPSKTVIIKLKVEDPFNDYSDTVLVTLKRKKN
jgi:hypothetical protein